MAMGRKLNNSARNNDKNQISSYVISRPKWLPSTEIWGPLDEYPGRRSCARNHVTCYNLEHSDWFGINYHIGILVYRDVVQMVMEIGESVPIWLYICCIFWSLSDVSYSSEKGRKSFSVCLENFLIF